MDSQKTRTPKKEDHVYAGKNDVEFIVVEVHHNLQVVDIRPLKGSKEVGPVEKGIPWRSLRYADEDVNQAAFRIVKEATED